MNENQNDTPLDRREARQQRREARRALRGGGEWLGGAVLILIGLLMFSQNLKIATFDNWWALFILLPAFGSFGTAWRITQSAGRFTMRARSAALVGVALAWWRACFCSTWTGPISAPACWCWRALACLSTPCSPTKP